MAVINLQAMGEHPLCGDGIHPEGFSYRSEEFMDHGIFFYNYGFTDMGVPSIDVMMNILHSIAFHVHIQKHKVAIHCHAGYGRTGIVIACWLIYGCGMQPEASMSFVRQSRPGCIETRTQKHFVLRFADDLEKLRRVFIIPPFVHDSFSLHEALSRQNNYLHGEERQTLSRVPKVVSVLCGELMKRVEQHTSQDVAKAFVDQADWTDRDEEELIMLKGRVNVDKWDGIMQSPSRFLAQLLLDWLDTLMEPIIPAEATRRAVKNQDSSNTRHNKPSVIDGVVSEYSLNTMNKLVKLLNSLHSLTPQVSELLYVRFAYALMHVQTTLPSPPPFRTLRATKDWLASLSEGRLQGPTCDYGDLPGLGRFLVRFVREWDDWSGQKNGNAQAPPKAKPHREPPPTLTPAASPWSASPLKLSGSMGSSLGGILGGTLHAPEALGLQQMEKAEPDPLEEDIAERVAKLFTMLGPRKQGYVINELLAIYGRTRLLTTPTPKHSYHPSVAAVQAPSSSKVSDHRHFSVSHHHDPHHHHHSHYHQLHHLHSS